jgi:CDGSH-type Zn-finger protein
VPEAEEPRISVQKDGPYNVRGDVPLSKGEIGCDESGTAIEWREGDRYPDKPAYALCRCGKSETKPYCDGSHIIAGFDGAETADRVLYLAHADVIEGPGVTLTDDRDLCAEARFCDARGGLWNRVLDAESEADCEAVVAQTGLCPSGRYVAWENESGVALEPDLEPSIVVVEDPQQDASGPLWVRGGITVESADGTPYETRNRVTLCRCGESKNKPFCDGTHLAVGFKDE